MIRTLHSGFRKYLAFGMLIGCLLSGHRSFAQGTTLGSSGLQSSSKNGAAPSAQKSSDQTDTGPAPTVAQAAPMAEEAKYRMFFRFIASAEAFAGKLEEEGKHDAANAWRSHVQRGAGLTEQEGAILKEIALDFNQAHNANNAKLTAAISSLRAQSLPGASQPVPMTPELVQIQADRQQILSAHVDQLKTQLGDASFKKVDAYIKDLYQSSVTAPLPSQPAQTSLPKGGAQ
jgi:hypothetical protein